jgi:allantoicase
MFSSGSLPLTHVEPEIPQLEALPLTYEAFLPYGRVAQAYSTPTAAPRGIVKTTANQGTAAKYHKMALVEDDYKQDGSEDHRTIISVMTAQPKIQTGSVWDVTVLEK